MAKIKLISKKYYKGDVYNLEIEDDHTFIANGVVTHNCPHCRKFYLMPNGEPRIYTMKQLKGNGTNYGLKTSQWKAIIPPMHPSCRCTLVQLPKGMGFKEGTQRTTYKGQDYNILKEQNKKK